MMRTMIFYSLTDAEIADPKLTERGLRDVKRHGFDSIYLEFRQTKAPLDAKRCLKAVERVCRLAKKLGFETIVDARLRGNSGLRDHPEIYSDDLMPVTVEVKDGAFTLETPGEILHREIAGAWRIEETGPWLLKKADDMTAKLTPGHAIAEGGGCAMTKRQPPLRVRQEFTVKGMRSGRLFLAVRYRYRFGATDKGHPALAKLTNRQLDLLEGLPLSGYAWDEPGYGFAFYPDEGRAISDRILDAFERAFGYDLAPRFIDLWYDRPGAKPASEIVRLHYAETLERGLDKLEKSFKREAKKRVGDDVTIGIHRTMHEETSDDLFFGSSDYFRHNANTSDGFTDSIFHREDSMVCMIQLARSMAVVSDCKRAFNNSWGFFPTSEQLDYYCGLMAMLNVRWIGHLYHGSNKFGPGYPDHPTWDDMKPRMDRLSKAVGALEGARPDADTAVVYNWRALNQFAGNYLHAHRSALMLLAKELTLSNTQFQFVSPELLGASTVKKGGTFSSKAGTFRRLIVPWPDLLTPKAWETLEALKAAGTEVVIYGPPAVLDSEGGDVAARFAALCGIKKPDPNAYEKAVVGAKLRMGNSFFTADPESVEPKYFNAPERTYPSGWRWWELAPKGGAEAVGTIGKKTVGAADGSVLYVAAEGPLFGGWTADVAAGDCGIGVPDGGLVARYVRDDETIWTVLGRWNRALTGKIAIGEHTVEIDGRDFAIVTQTGERKPKLKRFAPVATTTG